MRSRIILLMATAAAALVVGCGGGDSSSSGGNSVAPPKKIEPLAKLGAGEGKVDWVTPFEQKTGCQVNVKIGNTSDEMVTLMRTGRYDGVSASGDATLRLIAGGDVAPVNTGLVPNYADVFPGLKNQPFNSVDGQMYGIPHGRGANILMWRSDKIKTPLDSWAAVFDQASQYKGKVTAYDSPIYIADAALYLKSKQPDLKIDNPYELDDKQFQASVDLLKQQRGNIGEYWSDYTKEQSAFANGNSEVGTTWQIIANLLEGDKVPIKTTLPKEGGTGWSDTWMIASKAAHPNCMYMWMDWIISPKVNAEVAEWFGEAPSNAKACAQTAVKNHCQIFHAADQAYFDRVSFWTTPRKDCGDSRGAVCKDYSDWVQAWTDIKG
jgi:putative spermidine/putrescine transport system substrate-binding protein